MSSKPSKSSLCFGLGLSGKGFGVGGLVFCCLFISIWAIQVVAGAS